MRLKCSLFSWLVSFFTLCHISLTFSRDAQPKYYVNSSVCKMPYVNPFTDDIMKHFKRKKFRDCRNDSDLVTSEYDFEHKQYRLHLHEHVAKRLLKASGNATLQCSYQRLARNDLVDVPDHSTLIFPSHPLPHYLKVPRQTDFITTKCYVKRSTDERLIQQDGMTFIQDRQTSEEVKRKAQEDQKERKPSVFIMGLDSTSRMNLRRTMPQVFKYVSQPGWYEMQGYNKIGDNTWPNLLAVLTGKSEKDVQKLCDVMEPGCLDSLPFVWKRFKKHSYTTAFGEDCANINTFQYIKPGFITQPVDYYLRPFTLAIENMFPVDNYLGWAYCVGRHLSFSWVWDFGQQFIDRFIYKSPLFGMFWSNSITHDTFEGPTLLDQLFRDYLRQYEQAGLFKRSVVMLMSDHGHRYNTLRRAKSGYLEERLPMMFIYVPPWFRERYPNFVRNLQINRNRLSSNYDLYMTLHHLLQLNSSTVNEFNEDYKAEACKNCQSLFLELPFNRSCSQAGIDDKWCCCQPTQTISVRQSPYLTTISLAIVKRMNKHLKEQNLTNLCENFHLTGVDDGDLKMILPSDPQPADKDEQTYVLRFTTRPSRPLFEATVRWNNRTRELQMNVEELSRLNSYKKVAKCVEIANVKKYCICKNRTMNH